MENCRTCKRTDVKCCPTCGRGDGCDVYHKCGEDCIGYKPMTNADRIRSMTDEELANFLYRFNDIDEKVKFCTNKKVCIDLLDKGDTLPDEWCKECLLEWLKSEVGCE